jgi:hypothetical protein
MGVSVVLLTYNCARRLRECLESVTWADELVALDGGSTDSTRRLLAEYTPVIHAQPLDVIRAHGGNFDVARNAGFGLARHDWILVIDADEVVPAALRTEIRAAVQANQRVAYFIPRTNLFWGRPARLLGADYQLRLFPKGCAHYEGSYLDARPVVSCPVAHLTQPLRHYQAESIVQLLAKLHTRTSQRARVALTDPATIDTSAWSIFYHTFRYYYRQQDAAADGLLGAGLSTVYAAYPALTQLKLRRLRAQQRRSARPSPQS